MSQKYNMRTKIKNSSKSLDQYIGNKIKARRALIGMSQERLGARLGITFQQIQKYEKGTNRVSASMLYNIANILNVDYAFFTDGFSESTELHDSNLPTYKTNSSVTSIDLKQRKEESELIKAFSKLKDYSVKRKFISLLKAFVSLEENTKEQEQNCNIDNE